MVAALDSAFRFPLYVRKTMPSPAFSPEAQMTPYLCSVESWSFHAGDLFLVAGEVFLGVGVHPHGPLAFAGDDAVHRRETDEKVEAGVAEQRQGGPGLLEIGHQLLDGVLVFGAPQVRVAGFSTRSCFNEICTRVLR